MSDAYLGEIYQFGFGWAPRGFALCDGQILPIAQNTALFSLLGITFGGDGRTTFALPDLRGRAPVFPGMDVPDQGTATGQEQVTLLSSEVLHNHPLNAVNATGDTALPFAINMMEPHSLANADGGEAYGPAQTLSPIGSGSVFPAGGGIPHNNMQPFLTICFCIAMMGVFPSRN